MKIGDKVHCTAYVKKRGCGIHVEDFSPFDDLGGLADEFPARGVNYYDADKKETVWIPYSEFTEATVDKFKTIAKEFDGIYVGTTHLATKIWAIYEEWGGGGSIRFRSTDIKKFAVVYYANNKKRLVPIDCLKGGG